MSAILDVRSLPQERMYGPEGQQINLASLVLSMRPAVDELARAELVKVSESFGFAMADPSLNKGEGYYMDHYNDPNTLIWFVAGWGPERDRYIANAVRKVRAAARTEYDTLAIRGLAGEFPTFEQVVESQEPDGSFAWGDFPWGGAVHLDCGQLFPLGGVSGLSETEDHAVAALALGLIAAKMRMLDELED